MCKCVYSRILYIAYDDDDDYDDDDAEGSDDDDAEGSPALRGASVVGVARRLPAIYIIKSPW